MYASYAYYKSTYGGGLSETAYAKAAARAEAIVKYLTYLRGDIFQDISASDADALKMACCAAADVVASRTATDTSGAETAKGVIKSETTDGYSVTYAGGGTDSETAETAMRKAVYEAIKIYLMPTGWLFRGAKVRWSRHDYELYCDTL